MRPMRSLLLLCLVPSLLLAGCMRPAPLEQSTRPDAAEPTAADERSAAAQTAECTSDADCGLTLVGEGECCPMLCTPRGVSTREARALEKKSQECEQRQPCPVPACAPPRRQPIPVCEAGRCAVRHVNLETR